MHSPTGRLKAVTSRDRPSPRLRWPLCSGCGGTGLGLPAVVLAGASVDRGLSMATHTFPEARRQAVCWPHCPCSPGLCTVWGGGGGGLPVDKAGPLGAKAGVSVLLECTLQPLLRLPPSQRSELRGGAPYSHLWGPSWARPAGQRNVWAGVRAPEHPLRRPERRPPAPSA